MVKSQEGRIVLEGRCRIEDAETLLQALQHSHTAHRSCPGPACSAPPDQGHQ
jgi:hypothetical protein